jgi:ribosomal protein L11 methyltransferase
MQDAIRFEAVVEENHSEEFLGLCYSIGMIGCEEVALGDDIKYPCYFSDETTAKECIAAVSSFVKTLSASELIEDRDWNAKWRETIESVKVTDNIWVSPEWLEPPLKDNDYWIKIEPRMAFGTGHHETTRLCAQQVVSERNGSESLLDIGTGSGILAFIAEYAGYKKIVGVEIDPDCEINLKENLDANSKGADIEFIIGTVDKLESSRKFDTVVMNMISSISTPLLGEAKSRLNSDGMLIWSGLLVTERESCIEAAKSAGFKMIADSSEGEWWSARFSIDG